MIATGDPGLRPPHTDKCRQRVYDLMDQDESPEARARAEMDRLRRGAPKADATTSTSDTPRDPDAVMEQQRQAVLSAGKRSAEA